VLERGSRDGSRVEPTIPDVGSPFVVKIKINTTAKTMNGDVFIRVQVECFLLYRGGVLETRVGVQRRLLSLSLCKAVFIYAHRIPYRLLRPTSAERGVAARLSAAVWGGPGRGQKPLLRALSSRPFAAMTIIMALDLRATIIKFSRTLVIIIMNSRRPWCDRAVSYGVYI
jgi:hypothetical protein